MKKAILVAVLLLTAGCIGDPNPDPQPRPMHTAQMATPVDDGMLDGAVYEESRDGYRVEAYFSAENESAYNCAINTLKPEIQNTTALDIDEIDYEIAKCDGAHVTGIRFHEPA